MMQDLYSDDSVSGVRLRMEPRELVDKTGRMNYDKQVNYRREGSGMLPTIQLGSNRITRLIYEYRKMGGGMNWIAMTGSEFLSFDGHIKQTDAVVVGVYPKERDHVALNARYTAEAIRRLGERKI